MWQWSIIATAILHKVSRSKQALVSLMFNSVVSSQSDKGNERDLICRRSGRVEGKFFLQGRD